MGIYNLFIRVKMKMKMKNTKFKINVISACLLSTFSMSSFAADEHKSIEKITVIGEKIERSLKDTTSSVSVLSEEEINSSQFKSVTEIISEIANVVTLSGAVPDIRGVSGNGGAGGFNSISGGAKGRVSTLIDGVAQPFVADRTGDSGMWDIEQIEVYRGPQSTTNGRNSIAGAIYIKTKDPTEDWEGAARVSYRNQDRYVDTSAVISGPLTDTVSFRLSAQKLDADTMTDDTEYESNPANYDLNAIDSTNIRAKLQWQAQDDLTFLLTHSSSNEQGDTGRVYYEADDIDSHNRIFFRDIETDVETTSIDADYEINDYWHLEVLIANMNYDYGFQTYQEDPDDTQILTFSETNLTIDAKLSFGQQQDTTKGFVGLAYFEREHDLESSNAYIYSGNDESDSLALYGEVSFDITENLSVITGARLEKETQLRNFVYGSIDATLDNDTNIFLPKVVLQYDWDEATTVAISARKGYNAAGGALNFTEGDYYYFDEEEVNTYEISTRSRFSDGEIFLSTNLFYNDYDGYQALSSTRYITNMDKTTTYGLEVDLKAFVTEDFKVNAGLGLLKTKINDAGEDYPGVDGNELNSAPTITANLGAKYWLSNEFHVGASVSYVDEYFGDFSNDEEQIAGGYSLVRMQSTYELDNWLVSAFVNNVFDEEAVVTRVASSTSYPTGYVSVTDPRNMGVSVTYRF